MEDSCCSLLIRVGRTVAQSYEAVDAMGKTRFFAKKKLSLFGKTYVVSDESDAKVAQIHQCFALVLPKYRVTVGEDSFFTVRRKFSIQTGYVLNGIPWSLDGDVPGRRFRVTDKNGSVVFELEKINNSWTDKYVLNATDRSFCLRSVCIAIAMEAANEDIRNARKG